MPSSAYAICQTSRLPWCGFNPALISSACWSALPGTLCAYSAPSGGRFIAASQSASRHVSTRSSSIVGQCRDISVQVSTIVPAVRRLTAAMSVGLSRPSMISGVVLKSSHLSRLVPCPGSALGSTICHPSRSLSALASHVLPVPGAPTMTRFVSWAIVASLSASPGRSSVRLASIFFFLLLVSVSVLPYPSGDCSTTTPCACGCSHVLD